MLPTLLLEGVGYECWIARASNTTSSHLVLQEEKKKELHPTVAKCCLHRTAAVLFFDWVGLNRSGVYGIAAIQRRGATPSNNNVGSGHSRPTSAAFNRSRLSSSSFIAASRSESSGELPPSSASPPSTRSL